MAENKSIIPSTDVIQLTLTLKMTTAQVVETSLTVNNNSPIQDYLHPDDQTQPTFEMAPGLKPFTKKKLLDARGPFGDNVIKNTARYILRKFSYCYERFVPNCFSA